MKIATFLSTLLVLCSMSVLAQQAQTQPVTMSIASSQVNIVPGQETQLRVAIRNPYLSEVVTIKATAIYTDFGGAQRTVESNSVSLNVDAALRMRLSLSAPGFRLVQGSATFDGQPISPVANTLDFDVTIPGDGADHILLLRVVR